MAGIGQTTTGGAGHRCVGTPWDGNHVGTGVTIVRGTGVGRLQPRFGRHTHAGADRAFLTGSVWL